MEPRLNCSRTRAVRRTALTHLLGTRDIRKEVGEFTPLLNGVLGQILLEQSFVDERVRFEPQPQLLLSATPMPRVKRRGLQPGAQHTTRTLHAEAKPYPSWRNSALAAASEAACGKTQSDDAKILLVLLSFFSTPDVIPSALVARGVAPCKRWTAQGGIEGIDAKHTSLSPELLNLLSDTRRLENSFTCLERAFAVTKHDGQTYTISTEIASRVRERLQAEHLCFWRHQALLVIYRAIPWKYTEPVISNAKLFLPHLKYALQELQDNDEPLSATTRIDLALTLVESSRLSNLSWRRWATDQVARISRGLNDMYMKSRITESYALLKRITGTVVEDADSDHLRGWLINTVDIRMRHADGQASIQRALDYIQVDDLFAARAILEQLSTLDHGLSLMEQIVIFRKDMLLGRVLRFLGAFDESRMHLERARQTADQTKDLVFDEDFGDLTCDHADTLRELNDAVTAEQQLRAEILRQDRLGQSTRKNLLCLSLSEVLFAQGRFEDSEKLCVEIESRAGLLKMERLRLSITRAKLRHVQSDHEAAFAYWSRAMTEVGKYQLNGGSTTQIIVMSICDALSELGHNRLMQQSLDQVQTLGQLVKPGRAEYWIAGMRDWVEFLKSRNVRSRI